MKDKFDKHIKNLLETPQVPPPDAWSNIQMSLPAEKKDKRIIPFWFKLSGIAISMLLMLGIGYFFGLNSYKKIESIAETPNSIIQTPNNSSIDHDFNQISNELNSVGLTQNHTVNEIDFPQSNSTVNSQNNLSTNYFEKVNKGESIEQLAIQSIFSTEAKQQFWDEIIFENHPDQETFEVKHDSIEVVDNHVGNTLLSKVEIQDDNADDLEIKKKKMFDRFHLSAFASPLSFNAFVGKSMLNEEFNDFPTENNVTISYGVKGAYSLTNKLKVRTGISMIGLEQMTHEVPLVVSVEGKNETAATLKDSNINYSGNIRIKNPQSSHLINSELQERTESGRLQQQAQYLEIPLEAEFKFAETNSIGISLTGGASTWLLSKNKLYVHTHNTIQELGKADNLNSISFSANAGLKFDMNLFERVKLNVEPNFKYLINPVNDIKKYNPYTLGVNAGITVSFK